MIETLGLRISNNRRFLPLWATIALFALVYLFGAISYPAMQDGQAFFNLFITTPFLLILVVGEGLVILSGGIDLSVSGIVALTTVASAALLQEGVNPWLVIVLMLGMGLVFGAVMGYFITYLKVQPFIATLAGMWLARGLCYIISDSEIRIYDPLWKKLAGTKILIPGLSDPATKSGDYITVLVVAALVVLAIGVYVAQYTRFGRTIYAMGGFNGANEQSARLMGLSVDRTKVQVYMVSGLCSALAGIAYSVYVGSGHGTHATGMELTTIAAVVIGGIALTGGEGYLIGALFGVLIWALIQSLLLYNGTLSSWWTSIAIGVLMLVFIGVQSILAAWNANQIARARAGGIARPRRSWRQQLAARRRLLLSGVGAVLVIVLAAVGLSFMQGGGGGANASPTAACAKALRSAEADKLINDGAVIAFVRNGGGGCLDELYAIYPDGRVTGDNGAKTTTTQATPETVTKLLTRIDGLGWFTPDMYSTSPKPCPQCYTYYTTVAYHGQVKGVTAVDGNTITPGNYWQVMGQLMGIVPKLSSAP